MPATDKNWRDLKSMHMIFAISGLTLFGSVLWMMAKDHDREWRHYQAEFQLQDAEQMEAKKHAIESPEYQQKLKELEDAKKAALDASKANGKEIAALQSEVDKLTGHFQISDRNTKFKRAERDVARADYDLGVRDNFPKSEMDPLKKAFDESEVEVAKLEDELLKITNDLNDAKAKLADIMKPVTEAEDAVKKASADVDRLDKARVKLKPKDYTIASIKRVTMTWPIIDGFNSPLKIQQDWLPNLLINYGGLKDVARFDRCRSCHLGIDRVEAGNLPSFPLKSGPHEAGYDHPFATHPNPDLFLSASSPHPTAKFGCTICHEGQGSGTSFTDASHTPNTPAINAKWEKDHHFHANHFWEYPMYPERFREASCVKCHHNVVELGNSPKFGSSAPKVVEGYNIIRQFGCFGCHEINGFDGAKSIGPDLRLEPQTAEEAAKLAEDPNARPGAERKVGPSLSHVANKTTPEWLQQWTNEPASFRPTTRMPQFFHLEGQKDELGERYAPLEVAAISHYLMSKSTPVDMLKPADGYEPDADRGQDLFAKRGCVACHSHADIPGSKQDFGPDLSRISEKLHEGQKGFEWLYTWIRDPERHHPRTKMPNLYLEAYTQGDTTIDPAADIAAWLLSKGSAKFEGMKYAEGDLKELAAMYLTKALNKQQSDKIFETGKFPVIDRDLIKGDEVELHTGADGTIDNDKLMNYVGRRTISRYGCYGCHDIPGFEKARPIGTALQNWGRKDSSKLAMEHIHEFLHHHGEPDGSSTAERAVKAANMDFNDDFTDPTVKEEETRVAFFYDRVLHNDRAGFLWQKLRSPRSYDYKKIETKSYEERLRMPKFPFTPRQIEAVATFVLGLVAEPPAPQYVYTPKGRDLARIQGDKLLTKFNCTSCHMLEMPKVSFAVESDSLEGSELTETDFPEALELLLKLKPPRDGDSGIKIKDAEGVEKSVVNFHGLLFMEPDEEEAPEDRIYPFDVWETLKVGDKMIYPGTRIVVPGPDLQSMKPAVGGSFAEWLVKYLVENSPPGEVDRNKAWQMSPPPLYLEGIKVQTPWLYNFLRNPTQVRHTTVLRMPRFNMSDDEARALADYFSAVDGAEFPYQQVPQRDAAYLNQMELGNAKYQQDAWTMMNSPLCTKCHAVGGRPYISKDPKDIRGPNFVNVGDRLRPEWVKLWILHPNWITPYTSMPVNFEKGKPKAELFGGDGLQQAIAIRDSLMNYHRLMETFGKVSEQALAAAGAQPAPATTDAATPPAEEEKPNPEDQEKK
ncbi:MAG: c-type cytochrome [Planctomycetaceae bacterium]|nr:c-type cytochrome [Planctomycetaceae bacterium]